MILTLLLQVSTAADKRSISKMVSEMDPYGLGMTAIGMGVVFLSLLLLYLAFFNVTRLLAFNVNRQQKKKSAAEEILKQEELSGEVNAAIALALHLYSQELHDEESSILTMSKVGRTYSPWSSKIYGLRQFPR